MTEPATPSRAAPVIITIFGATGDLTMRNLLPAIYNLTRDLASARELNQQISRVFAESQVYRIDHYLGKQTVQNMLVFRFANGIFEPIWNRNYVDHVQITVCETIGVEGRGPYYETAGALR